MSEKETPKQLCEDLVKKDFRFFNEIYSSEKEMLEYCLKFYEIFGEPKRAIEEFFTFSEFYRAMKMMKDDFVKLIMITSIIEKLSSKRDFMDFSGWLSERKREDKLRDKSIEEVWQEYNKDFGCSGKFRRFFENPEYLSKTEQITLLKSIRYFIRNDDRSVSQVPLFCYNKERCGVRNHGCEFDSDANCPAFKEEKVLKNGIKEFADFLYNLRNKFVHDAHMFGLSSEEFGTTSFFADYVPYKFRHIKRQSSYKGHVVFRLSAKKLEEILNRNFKKLLDNYTEMGKKPEACF